MTTAYDDQDLTHTEPVDFNKEYISTTVGPSVEDQRHHRRFPVECTQTTPDRAGAEHGAHPHRVERPGTGRDVLQELTPGRETFPSGRRPGRDREGARGE